MIPLVDLRAQYLDIKADIDAAIARVFESVQFVLGDEVAGFEREFAAYSGASEGIAVNTGKTAMVTTRSDDGSEKQFEVIVRIDTPAELEYYRSGGILPYVLRQVSQGGQSRRGGSASCSDSTACARFSSVWTGRTAGSARSCTSAGPTARARRSR